MLANFHIYGFMLLLRAVLNILVRNASPRRPMCFMCLIFSLSGPCELLFLSCCCCLPTPMTLASGGESDVPACGPPASFSVHLASSAVTPAGSVHKSRGDNVVCMWVQLKR